MRSICFFASYFKAQELPYYVCVYLAELKRHFAETVLLCSSDPGTSGRKFLQEKMIGLQVEANEGFDFGLWYKAFQKTDITVYDQLVLVNDSCILFKPLDEFLQWSQHNKAAFQGMTRSEAVMPHLQSYFLLFQKPAISFVKEYFNNKGEFKNIGEVIREYEIGLSTFLLANGLDMAAFVDNDGYSGEFSPYFYCIDYHLRKGIPLIKKKIIFSSYRKDELFTLARMNFNIDPKHYLDMIKREKDRIIDPVLLLSLPNQMNEREKLKYNVNRILIRAFRPVYRILKGA